MLLEDQPLISLDIEEALVERGFRDVITLRSQKEALDSLDATSPDFVLLDLFLADGDSRPVLAILKQRGIRHAIYSGSQRPSEWDQYLLEGCDWFEKPVDPDILAKVVSDRVQEA
jgi:DNA-binding response OmpR family regulator